MLTRRERTPLRKLMFLGAMAGAGALVEDTATGNPLTFVTDKAKPLKSLLIPFTPKQEGSGDPSPQNVRSILPWDGVTVDHVSENLFKNSVNQTVSRYLKISLYGSIPAGTYIFTATVDSDTQGDYVGIGFSKGENNVIATAQLPKTGRNSVTFTINDSVSVIYLYAGLDYSLSAGLKATYSGILITENAPERHSTPFPTPCYGGTLDVVTGVLTVEWWSITPKWKDKWYGAELTNVERRVFIIPNKFAVQTSNYYNSHKSEILCNRAKWNWSFNDDSVHFYTAEDQGKRVAMVFQPIGTDEETEIQIIGTLSTPQTVTLTAEQITALVGDNTMWSDADGSMTAVFYKKG